MNRDILINFIPKPTNSEVILYDTSLKDLIDVDVIKEYNDLLPIYNESAKQYLDYMKKIENYEKTINEVYLFKSNWSEEDYLYHLQNEKKTYSNLFNSIKKIENNIEMLKKKVHIVEQKIEMQTIKEDNEIENKKKNIDAQINENIEKLLNLREMQSTLKIEKKKNCRSIARKSRRF